MTLPAGVLGRSDTNATWRVLVLAEPRPREVLQLARERLVARARAHDERLHDLPAQGVRDADHGGLAHVGVLEQHVLADGWPREVMESPMKFIEGQ